MRTLISRIFLKNSSIFHLPLLSNFSLLRCFFAISGKRNSSLKILRLKNFSTMDFRLIFLFSIVLVSVNGRSTSKVIELNEDNWTDMLENEWMVEL